MSKVYIVVENPKFDYVPALAFGELQPVFPTYSQVQASPHEAIAHAQQRLAQLTSDDYLLCTGDPVLIGICVAVAAALIGKVKLLRWDRLEMVYVPITLDFTGLDFERCMWGNETA